MSMTILVAGATGKTGLHLVQELVDLGHEPTALVRESLDTSALPRGVELRLGELTDVQAGVCDGMDAGIFVAGSGGYADSDMTDKVDRDGAKRLIDLARDAGVMRSSVGAEQSDPPGHFAHYLKAKHAADEHLIASRLTYAILCPVASANDARGSLACHNPIGRPVTYIIRLRDHRLCITTSRVKSSISRRSPSSSERARTSASRILMVIGHVRSAARNYLK